MNEICIHISGSQSNQLMRVARGGDMLTAVAAHDHQIPPLDDKIRSVDDLEFEALTKLLRISDTNPLKLLVANDASRRWSSTLQTTLLSTPLPKGAFLELKNGTSETKGLVIPHNLRIFINSPTMALVEGARVLERKVKTGNAQALIAFLKLLAFADECCGSYWRSPAHPHNGTVHYDKPHKCTRFSSPSDIRASLAATRGLDGLGLARKVANYVIDESGSPMETYLNHALTLPPRLAGLSIKTPLANKQIVLDDRSKTQLRHSSLRPDLQWPEYKTLVEYLGDEDHASKSARVEDKNRIQDYAKTPYTAFVLMYDDVCNAAALNRTAQMIARELMRRGLKGELYRVNKLLRNKGFLARQRLLLATMLPPVRRYD